MITYKDFIKEKISDIMNNYVISLKDELGFNKNNEYNKNENKDIIITGGKI